ncbi:MAG: DUF1820 family protein [Gammaproteobacteria bacterium]|nr:DUF1820 family protein [Gammaproteobacteria bacterium]
MAAKKKVYKVIFHNQGKIYEIYARNVEQGDLLGFVEISGLIFGEKSKMLVDPGEEKLEAEFSGVESCLIPMHAVVRIDQVTKEGHNKILAEDQGGNITAFPSPIIAPRRND